jgi:hypothetical protein
LIPRLGDKLVAKGLPLSRPYQIAPQSIVPVTATCTVLCYS